MRKLKNPKVGDVVQFENGNLDYYGNRKYYDAGIIRKIGVGKTTGKKVAVIEYPSDGYGQIVTDGNGRPFPITKATLTKNVFLDRVYEYDSWNDLQNLEHPREYFEENTYSPIVEFLIDNGIYSCKF